MEIAGSDFIRLQNILDGGSPEAVFKFDSFYTPALGKLKLDIDSSGRGSDTAAATSIHDGPSKHRASRRKGETQV